MSIYDTLNKEQREAVFHTEGPVLLLAGAGSGKTRVLTHRIAYLIQEMNVSPYHILAITFTNKAAGEMRERVDNICEYGGESVWVSTFHSMCVRILRRYIDKLGYDTNFTIYDTEDQKSLMKEICKKLDLDTKVLKERTILSAISSAKNEMQNASQYENQNAGDYKLRKIAQAYIEYEKQLRLNNALDFDDLLFKTVELFKKHSDVLESYQERFRYIMVDEYQDTNTVQFQLVSLLANKYKNLCVVGDDDQSIYKFRGADITNILNFEQMFGDTTIIKLEQNYRSTGNILNAANAVIQNNTRRKDKRLWTDKGDGEKIQFKHFDSGYDEASTIVKEMKLKVKNEEMKYKDFAILYRTNAQSRIFEEKLIMENVPYKIIGGVNFYARKEIKDLLAYLRVINNAKDDLAIRRIINVPARGIGLTTVNKIQECAFQEEKDFYEIMYYLDGTDVIGRSASKVQVFVGMIEEMKTFAMNNTLISLLEKIIVDTGYTQKLELATDEESKSRMENIGELITKVKTYEENCQGEPSLNGFLEEVALLAEIEEQKESADYVVLMTLHSAKGLEFPYVYLTGLEDGMFPSYMCITSDDPMEMEEERRLCYVGITRAMESLTLSSVNRRMIRGETQYNKVSRFLKEIPVYLMEGGTLELKEPRNNEKIDPIKDAKLMFKKQAFMQNKPKQQFTVAGGDGPGYQVGDRVKHVKFGEGLVTGIIQGGRDYEVTVQFDEIGVKKMFAMFAKLEKI